MNDKSGPNERCMKSFPFLPVPFEKCSLHSRKNSTQIFSTSVPSSNQSWWYEFHLGPEISRQKLEFGPFNCQGLLSEIIRRSPSLVCILGRETSCASNYSTTWVDGWLVHFKSSQILCAFDAIENLRNSLGWVGLRDQGAWVASQTSEWSYMDMLLGIFSQDMMTKAKNELLITVILNRELFSCHSSWILEYLNRKPQCFNSMGGSDLGRWLSSVLWNPIIVHYI